MDILFTIILVFLGVLSIIDLFVGVSNDAVNFLNSAVGAKAAPFRTVLIVAAIGVFIGAALSNGMMDIARHGIYNPSYFSFREVMIICLTAMISDVILLNIFNTLGLPTSTTVTMVFNLLGSAFTISMLKISGDTTGSLELMELINTSKALQVIVAIFMSVVIAIFFGTLVMWISRVIFSFNYKKNLKYFSGLFGGLAITAIIYFMIFQGLKESAFMTPEYKQWLSENTLMLLSYIFVGSAVVMQILNAFKVNIFKVIILAGTLALSLAFAGNDLVNFIGIPLSGLSAFQDYMASKLAKGAPITAIAAIIENNTSGIITNKNLNINSPKELAGHKYGTWDIPIELNMLQFIMEKDGGDYSKVELVPNTDDNSITPLSNGVFDAAPVYYAWDKIMGDSLNIETNFFYYKDYAPELNFYSPVIIANNDYLKDNKEEAIKILRAIKKGYQYAIEHPEEAAEILIKYAPELENKKAMIIESQKYLASQYATDKDKWGYIDPARWNAFYQWLYDNKLVESDLTKGQYFSNDYLGAE